MSRVVLDASALLALIHEEQGSEKLRPELLNEAVISAVNLAEVQGKFISRGWQPEEAWQDATGTIHETLDFTAEHARIAASLIAETRAFGLSLGDRACLALGLALQAPIYTSDRTWKNLKLPVRIHTIR